MLLHRKGRFVLSVAGVSFAVVVMFMEIGFLSGFKAGQQNLLPLLRGDLVVLKRTRETLAQFQDTFPLARLNQARQFAEVREVVPVYEGIVAIKNPDTGRLRRVNVLAFPPNSRAVALRGPTGSEAALKRTDSFLWDAQARPLFGRLRQGDRVEIAGVRLRLAGTFGLGANFTRDGCVIIGDGTWFSLGGDPDRVSIGLIRTRAGTDLAALQDRIRAALPDDIGVFSLAALAEREDAYVVRETPVGVIFGSGLVIGFIIGVVICYQTLFNEVLDHLPQYAMIRALGFGDNYLRGVVLREAVLLAVVGYLPGVALSFLLYAFLSARSGLAMDLTPARLALVFFLTIPMCCTAGLLSLRKALQADPAEIF